MSRGQEAEAEPKGRRWPRIVAIALGGLVVVLAVLGGILTMALRGSLPRLTGEVPAPVEAAVVVERDAVGVPTLRGAHRADLAYAIGFVHAQERFFQMDLTRRAAAGELAALFGPAALDFDRQRRIHRARHVAEQAMAALPPRHRVLVERYAEGVNAGLADLDSRPFEYQLLRQEPRPWRPADTGLVMLAMFFDLQDESARWDRMRAAMADALPPELAAWLVPRGSARWDAPIDGLPVPLAPMPGPEVLDIRRDARYAALREGLAAAPVELGGVVIGSNSWAVAGHRSHHGGAMVANDMHLALRVPIIWYRAAWEWTEGEARHRIEGVTLPGGPVVVVGSNGRVAWAFTNSMIDAVDAVRLEVEGEGPSARYRTPDGPEAFVTHTETIEVAGGAPVEFSHRWTRWGPVVDAEVGRPMAIRWIGHDPAAVDLAVLDFERVADLEGALDIANRAGIPPQNCVVADAGGRIAWTIMGYVPARFGPVSAVPVEPAPAEGAAPPAPAEEAAAEPPLFLGFDGRFPMAWGDGRHGWKGRLPAAEYPRIVDPPEGLIWTGNARIVGGEMYAKLGDAGYALGARQQQIRDGLRNRSTDGSRLTEADMLAMQLDDRAVFLTPWRAHLRGLLERADKTPLRARLAHHLDQSWTGRASVDSVGYRLVRDLRLAIAEAVFGALTLPAAGVHPDFAYLERGAEGPLWQLVTEAPPHLLHPAHATWEAWQLAIIDEALMALTAGADDPVAALDARTWGEANAMRVQHPLVRGLPALRNFLSAPSAPLPGDDHMPRVQGPDDGASERLAVSPGREDEGYLLLPGGQTGHPLSAHFLDQYPAWAEGTPRPFRPGPAVHTLTFTPGAP